jgi:hypothetical protein
MVFGRINRRTSRCSVGEEHLLIHPYLSVAFSQKVDNLHDQDYYRATVGTTFRTRGCTTVTSDRTSATMT